MSYNKITDPISGKKIELNSSRGKTILRNYLELQAGGAYYDKYLGKIDLPLFGAYGLWGKYWDYATKKIHVHKNTPRGVEIDMHKTKVKLQRAAKQNANK